MIAIVCDKCGKVMPQADYNEFKQPEGVDVLRYWGPEKNGSRTLEKVELCQECTDEVLLVIRNDERVSRCE